MTVTERLVIFGRSGPQDVGTHLLAAADRAGISADLVDYQAAFAAARPIGLVSWHVFGRRPPRLGSFSREAVAICRRLRPRWVVMTGIAPIASGALREIAGAASTCINYLTDDPWNPAHRSRWFLAALPHYDFVFSTRKANMNELRELGCRSVEFLPFGYEPTLHFPEELSEADRLRFASDVAFVGGADRDRLPFMKALLDSGIDLALYGGYWDKSPELRRAARGFVEPDDARRVLRATKVAPVLVRRANRDESSMRTFETAAIGACIVAEDTAEHRSLFSADGEGALYFSTPSELVSAVQRALASDDLRERLARRSHEAIVAGANSYDDRLATMLAAP